MIHRFTLTCGRATEVRGLMGNTVMCPAQLTLDGQFLLNDVLEIAAAFWEEHCHCKEVMPSDGDVGSDAEGDRDTHEAEPRADDERDSS